MDLGLRRRNSVSGCQLQDTAQIKEAVGSIRSERGGIICESKSEKNNASGIWHDNLSERDGQAVS